MLVYASYASIYILVKLGTVFAAVIPLGRGDTAHYHQLGGVMARKVFSYVFVVLGEGTFPLDMLRYDRCCPVTGDDVDSLLYKKEREIILVHYDCKNWEPSGRWASFGWRVVSCTEGNTINE